ncbi:MAG TPA: ABC transporter ATP-binding protein [Thermomicrobiales bacterium]|nr:ABC transporter ATP-binding protein [Thermomicrobiales bacterium]
MVTGSEPALALAGIAVRHHTRALLDDVSLAVRRGETVALLGPNGAGKTTLLHVAALLRRPDAGRVEVGGEAAHARTERRLRRHVALVPQQPLLFSTSVLANAAAGLRFAGIARPEADRRTRPWLERFGVAHLADRGVQGLSGGESQRVALARAFALEPPLLLLDEPFAGLDAPSRDALLPLLAGLLRDRGTTTLLVTHDLDEAVALADRLGVLVDGRLVQFGPISEALARPGTAVAARLLGVENLLLGRVRRAVDGRVEVALEPHGPAVPATASTPLALGDPVLLAIRAGALSLVPTDALPAAGHADLVGTVRSVAPSATGPRVVVDAGQEVVVLLAWGTPALPFPGERVGLRLPHAAAHAVPRSNDGSAAPGPQARR